MNRSDRPTSSHCQIRATLLAVIVFFSLANISSIFAAESGNGSWRYTLKAPSDRWYHADFDDSNWNEGQGGFGTRGTPGARVGTTWKTNDIWLRRAVEIAKVPESPGLFLHHDEDTEVFINGVKVLALSGWSTEYSVVKIPAEHHALLKPGRNLIAVHCHQNTGGQYIDVIFADADNPPALPIAPPFKSALITRWGSDVTPENAWREYPRPQLRRGNWENLNGNWDYAITAERETKLPSDWAGKILVPFCLESKLGGVQRRLRKDEALWYHRTFDASPTKGRRTLLNFEAMDYRCEVFVNDKAVGKHQGGNTPFSFDITAAIKAGSNKLVVRVEDETEEWQLNGKQRRNPRGIFYTQVSGIWQTVWLEQVAESYVSDLTIRTDASRGTIAVDVEVEGRTPTCELRVIVKDGAKQVAEAKGTPEHIELTVANAKLWSPASPHLYDLEISLLDAGGLELDRIVSYAGIRTVGKIRDAAGHWRMTLNGQPIFHWGPLDQGWWPDGLLTPPSDQGMLFDVEWLKSAGFNMIRKHIKIEPRRYYYHCDRLGMMLWQDHVSGGKNPKWTRLAPEPNDADWPDENHSQFMLELERMIDELESHPSIVVWVPFNEAWGQHRTMEVGKWTAERDPTRIINIASGGNFWPVGDIADEHSYPNPKFPLDDKRFDSFVKVVGEFGGHGLPVKGHLWDASRDNWGYGGLPKNRREYRTRYVKSLDMLNELRKNGVAAGVYTQTTDVEGEINGLMTYDRKAIKISAEELRKLHTRLFE